MEIYAGGGTTPTEGAHLHLSHQSKVLKISPVIYASEADISTAALRPRS